MILIRIFFILLLLIVLSVVHVLQLLSLFLKPISETYFRRINASLAAFWWSLLVSAATTTGCISVRFFGQLPDPADPNVVIISNHQSLIDPLVILVFAKKMKSLPYLKWFVKNSLRHFPFLGWGLSFIDSIFLKRSWDQDKGLIAETFRKIRSHQDPVWLISFVEGTRLSPEKLIQSQKFALSHGVDPLQFVLFPRHKGFNATLEGLSGRIETVYDLTLKYARTRPTMMQLLKGPMVRVDVFFEKTNMSEITNSSELQKQWLIGQFRKKDQILGLDQSELAATPNPK